MRHRQPSVRGRRSHSGSAALAFTCLLALGGVGMPARAEPAPSTLIEWHAPDSCPGANVVYQRVSTLLGYAPSDWGPVDQVRGTIAAQPGQWLLTIDMQRAGERSTRLITAPRCEDLAEAAAIAIALALENASPDATGDGTASDTSQQFGARTPATSTNPADQKAVPSPRDAAAFGFSLGGEALLDFDALGSAAPGASLFAATRFGRAQLAVYGLFLPEQRRTLNQEQSVALSLLAAGLRVCYRLFDGTFWAAACAGTEAGRLQAEGIGLVGARRANNLWLAPSAGLELGVSIRGPLEAQLRVELLGPLPRKQYAINETDVIYRPPPLTPRVYIGLGWAPE
jgi:hypothetical protein